MLQNQHNEIQTTFGWSTIVLEQQFKDNTLYSQLVGNVSWTGLGFIFHEAKRAEKTGSDSLKYVLHLGRLVILHVLVSFKKDEA